jgi:hypothetical protein
MGETKVSMRSHAPEHRGDPVFGTGAGAKPSPPRMKDTNRTGRKPGFNAV